MAYSPLARRTFLRGLGLSVGLPLLDAMGPRAISAAPPVAPRRAAWVFFPNGAIMQDWTPGVVRDVPPEPAAGPRAQFELSKTLQGLSDFRDDLIVFTGLAQDEGRAKGDGPGDHARCCSTFLTGAHPFKTAGADIRVGKSVDQVAAELVGHQTRLPSLELGIDKGRNAGNCDSGYSCAYSSNISWKTETTPMAKEINPRLAFERLFGAGESSRSRKLRDYYRKSILDFVANDARQLQSRLGKNDQQKIAEYFTSVRELEQRIVRAEKASEVERPDFDIPTGVPGSLEEHVRLMYDILVLAFRTDTTRIATYMLGNAGSNRPYPMVDVNDGHHHLSHHGNNAEKMKKIQKIDRYLVDQFAYFLEKLRSVEEGDGTLLDHSMIVYGSGLADGNGHHHHNLPVVMAGGGGGSVTTGRHLSYLDSSKEMPLNNLFLSMLERIGASVDRLGDSDGRLPDLKV